MPANLLEPATLDDLLAELRLLRKVYAQGQAELLTATAAAQLLSISKPSLYRLAASGKMPRPVKIGGSSRWSRASLTNFIDNLK